jgi:hypothetical protein
MESAAHQTLEKFLTAEAKKWVVNREIPEL